MQNPSQGSNPTTKSPSSSPIQPPPPPPSGLIQTAAGDVTAATAEGGSSEGGVASSDVRIFQVADRTTGGDRSHVVGGSAGEGGSSAVAVSVDGGVVVERGASVASTVEKQGKQKRKLSQLSDPPPWPPKCNECGKEFPSFKAAFGHMRAHPNRDYRGFFKPPTSSSSSPVRQRVHQQGENINIDTGMQQSEGEKGPASLATTRGVGFDLNQPTKEETEPSSEVAERNEVPDSSSSAAAISSTEEEKKVGFDLNELPPSEDDDQHKP